jgi:hypothetical protein
LYAIHTIIFDTKGEVLGGLNMLYNFEIIINYNKTVRPAPMDMIATPLIFYRESELLLE